MTNKKKPLQILLTEEQKAFIRSEANKESITMNAYLLGLIKKDQKRVERGNK
tara:strand:- start:58 stop:213 length:156 start_codon:yes stop_codon:yes gene_type:complete